MKDCFFIPVNIKILFFTLFQFNIKKLILLQAVSNTLMKPLHTTMRLINLCIMYLVINMHVHCQCLDKIYVLYIRWNWLRGEAVVVEAVVYGWIIGRRVLVQKLEKRVDSATRAFYRGTGTRVKVVRLHACHHGIEGESRILASEQNMFQIFPLRFSALCNAASQLGNSFHDFHFYKHFQCQRKRLYDFILFIKKFRYSQA